MINVGLPCFWNIGLGYFSIFLLSLFWHVHLHIEGIILWFYWNLSFLLAWVYVSNKYIHTYIHACKNKHICIIRWLFIYLFCFLVGERLASLTFIKHQTCNVRLPASRPYHNSFFLLFFHFFSFLLYWGQPHSSGALAWRPSTSKSK